MKICIAVSHSQAQHPSALMQLNRHPALWTANMSKLWIIALTVRVPVPDAETELPCISQFELITQLSEQSIIQFPLAGQEQVSLVTKV